MYRPAQYIQKRLSGLFTFLAGSLLFIQCVHAVTIAPVMLELTPEKQVTSVRVRNDSPEPMTLQAETLNWLQENGEDIYTVTQDLLVVPPIAEIPAGSSQIFRVTLRKPSRSEGERAYRLMLEDVTTETSPQAGVLKFRFRHNLPVFIYGKNSTQALAVWSTCPAHAGQACVRLENRGNRHFRMSQFKVEGSQWRREFKGGMTVLPGAWREWHFDLEKSSQDGMRIVPTTDLGEILPAIELTGGRS